MAEEIDPFEAAMGAMDAGGSDPESAADAGPIDPFEAAMGALGGEGETSLHQRQQMHLLRSCPDLKTARWIWNP